MPSFSGAPPAGNLACFTLERVGFNCLLYGSEQLEQGIRRSGACGFYSQQHGGECACLGTTQHLHLLYKLSLYYFSKNQGGGVGRVITMLTQ